MPLPQVQNFNDSTDDVVLEDEVQRVKLVGNVNVGELVSGIVAGVVGNYPLELEDKISDNKLNLLCNLINA